MWVIVIVFSLKSEPKMQKEIAELKKNSWESMPADPLVAACTIGARLRAPLTFIIFLRPCFILNIKQFYSSVGECYSVWIKVKYILRLIYLRLLKSCQRSELYT